jgi:hypothetical protein
MLANWMLYCAAVGVLLSGGALALERGLRSLGRPTRWVWAAAMGLSLALPVAARYVPAPRAAPAAAPPAAPSAPRMAAEAPASPETKVRQPAPATLDLGRWDPALRLAWGGSSAAVLLGLAAMAGVLARRRRGWPTAEVDGVSVLVSPDVGPAVVGFFRSRIVLPAWVLSADEQARRLVLEHEREHLRAGDPRLLAAAIVCAALTPWSPAAWWQLRRLRLAIEVDCDARVLRRRVDVRAYGAVLLEVGRRAVRSPLAAAAFAEPVSFLERRLRIMTAPRVRRPLLRAAVFGALAVAFVAAACETPGPVQPSPGASRLYRAVGEAGGQPRMKMDLPEPIARYFADVARSTVWMSGKDRYVYQTLSPEGNVGGNGMVRRVLGTGAQADGTPVTLAAVEMKWPGDYWEGFRIPSRDGPPGTMRRAISGRTREDRSEWAVTSAGAQPPGAADQVQFWAAMDRFYPPAMRAAGVRGTVDMTFGVGADGRPRDVMVDSDNPALVPVVRAIAGSLVFPPGAGTGGRRFFLLFDPHPVPPRSR